MPARINLSNAEINQALAASGNLVSAAAIALKISTKTLRRRIAADPELLAKAQADPVWIRAQAGEKVFRRRYEAGGVRVAEYGESIPFGPRQLSQAELRDLFVWINAHDKFTVTVSRR